MLKTQHQTLNPAGAAATSPAEASTGRCVAGANPTPKPQRLSYVPSAGSATVICARLSDCLMCHDLISDWRMCSATVLCALRLSCVLPRAPHPPPPPRMPAQGAVSSVHPAPYTLQPTPYTLHPTPYTLQPTSYTLHPTPYTLHPTPNTQHPTPSTLHPTPYTCVVGANHTPKP